MTRHYVRISIIIQSIIVALSQFFRDLNITEVVRTTLRCLLFMSDFKTTYFVSLGGLFPSISRKNLQNSERVRRKETRTITKC